MFDPEKFGLAMAEAMAAKLAPIQAQLDAITATLETKAALSDLPKIEAPALPNISAIVADAVKTAVAAITLPEPLGIAGALIDRDGALQITLSNGEVKNLGRVEGKNGEPGKDGEDGVSFEAFDMRYIDETGELEVKATAGGITKEVRFHIGGMRGKGYWREGVTAKANEAWSYGGQLWIAVKETKSEPKAGAEDWFLGARKGKDADTIIRTAPSNDPIRLGN